MFRFIAFVFVACGISCPALGQSKPEGGQSITGRQQAPIVIMVQPGSETEARTYYKRISTVLKFDFVTSNLDSFLSHLGYSEPVSGQSNKFEGLLAEHLERIESFDLMPRNAAEFEVLAKKTGNPNAFGKIFTLNDFTSDQVLVSRFFAPKIATYFNPMDPYLPIAKKDIEPGWRKLVRLMPKSGSEADKVGKIAHIYLLFNYKKANVTVDPFAGNVSDNNQIIVVPNDLTKGDRVFFLVYQGRGTGYKLGDFLAADFDLPGHASANAAIAVAGGSDGKYYVPRSCAECHGHSVRDTANRRLRGEPVDETTGQLTKDFSKGVYKFAKPNYLDTDQWYDWLGYDYPGVAASTNDVIFDGGKNRSSTDYARAFDVIRKLNQTILEETKAAEVVPGTDSFQTLAARKWIVVHKTSNLHQGIGKRSIGTESWDTTDADQNQLLQLLNNHCFRCHSSVRYNVFDKAAVRTKAIAIGPKFLEKEIRDENGNQLPGFFMPQGRVLSDSERKELIGLFKRVFFP